MSEAQTSAGPSQVVASKHHAIGTGHEDGLCWFASVLEALEQSNANAHKLEVLKQCFTNRLDTAHKEDLAWLIYFLAGGKLPRSIRSGVLREAAIQASGLPAWLFEACYAHAGDLAETIAYCLDHAVLDHAGLDHAGLGHSGLDQAADVDPKDVTIPKHRSKLVEVRDHESSSLKRSLHAWLEGQALTMAQQPVEAQIQWLTTQWRAYPPKVRFAMNKIMTGGFRLGVSRAMVLRALADASGLPASLLAQRFMGWTGQLPSAERLEALLADQRSESSSEQVLPFCLAQSFDQDYSAMGEARNWQVEWKWDGIRVQWIAGKAQSYLWSRGEELMSEQFPDLMIESFRHMIPVGTLIDAELVAWDPNLNQVAGFAALQTRLNRKRVNTALTRSHPVVLIAYDLLRLGDEDLRQQALSVRREKLQQLASKLSGALMLSPCFSFANWTDLAELRQKASKLKAEGLILKHRDSFYGLGRSKIYQGDGFRGGWWKWKQDPFTVDAVLIYAQAGHGRRANLYTDYTFAVRGPNGWLSVAKAYSGLSDAEIREVDARIRKTSLEQFGPVRVVEPSMVFEIA
ncbi:MAG: cisplatin damage response ATP-dependent DNA ligase, partial [Betaproteobacteria bacterium]